MQSCGTRGKAPFEQVLTHGFVLDDQGYKMSKSSGNVTSPDDVLKTYGADIMRLWVCSSDYTEDLRVGENILKQNADRYRRFRNTLRYLIGASNGFSDDEKVEVKDMPDLEKFVLLKLSEISKTLLKSMEKYDFLTYMNTLHDFCNDTLSSLYFDIRKDCLYCDDPTSIKRRSVRTVMNILFEHLTKYLAPVLCFTAEEAWASRYPDGEKESIHLQEFSSEISVPVDNDFAQKWERILFVRKEVNAEIEKLRESKTIGSSLEAFPTITLNSEDLALLSDVDFAEICITSKASIKKGSELSISVKTVDGEKCERCWNKDPEVGNFADHPTLCRRCYEVITGKFQ